MYVLKFLIDMMREREAFAKMMMLFLPIKAEIFSQLSNSFEQINFVQTPAFFPRSEHFSSFLYEDAPLK